MEQYMILLGGFPASGKSTLSKEIRKNIQARSISMDRFRKKLEDGTLSQDDNDWVFYIYNKKIKEELSKGKNIVIDALNLHAKDRKYQIKNANKINPNIKKICVFIEASVEQCLKNNRSTTRGHFVQENYFDGIDKKYSLPTLEEGWDEIYIVSIKYWKNKIVVKKHITK